MIGKMLVSHCPTRDRVEERGLGPLGVGGKPTLSAVSRPQSGKPAHTGELQGFGDQTPART